MGGGFNPAVLGPTPDQFGNFTGNPAFVSAFDPRPGADGPGEFFQDANFDLTTKSAAIDAAIPSIAPPYDLLYRSRVRIPGRGFPGTGPADVGAFEFDGTGGLAVGGAFRVASTSLAIGGAALAAGGPITASQLGNAITVDFSGFVDPSSITPADLAISGTGVASTNPAHATSLTWIDAHTVEFMLSGNFNSSGTVSVSIPNGTIESADHQALVGFTDSVQIVNSIPTPTPTPSPSSSPSSSPTPTPTPTPTTTLTPAPASTPTAGNKKVKQAQKLEKQKLEKQKLEKQKLEKQKLAQEKHKKHHGG